MTYCLAIDTSGNWCSVALHEIGTETCFQVGEEIKRGHAEHILGFIDQVFMQAGFDDPAAGYSHLSRLAVVTGPGSFTGLRVGLSVARGIALAQSIPCVGVTSLLSVVVTASRQCDLKSGDRATIHAAVSGRGGQIFYQPFHIVKTDHGADVTEQAAAQNIFPSAVDAFNRLQGDGTPDKVYIAGSGCAEIRDDYPSLPDQYFIQQTAPSMAQVAIHANSLDPKAHPPEPHYLRDADAVKAKAVFPLKPA